VRETKAFDIPYYQDYISPGLAEKLLTEARPVAQVSGLVHVGDRGGLETDEALKFLCELYEQTKSELGKVLSQRVVDRKFIDERVKACFGFNRSLGREISDKNYQTVLGLEDAKGRVVIGALTANFSEGDPSKPIAPIPKHLLGPHVTLFGPPDSAKMAINAMNAYHRRLKDEPKIVAELLDEDPTAPFWGADDEDSKTPLREDLIDAGINLSACFAKTLELKDQDKKYELARDHLSLPLKRFPGLALPTTFLFLNGNPLPLHLYDFALHLFHHRHQPEALTFYVPKLENEEEARYIHHMVKTAEELIQRQQPDYHSGSVRLMIVLENPRAILRVHEIMDELHPYFVGASLGWHDYLASTARLFKEDGNYRIPVKADPHIVIKYIKASHQLLADVVGSRGGVKVGGMYGILPQTPGLETDSFQITMKGFLKDVITQLKRELTGFWVAHPDFVRLGLALVKAWGLAKAGKPQPLNELVRGLLQPQHQEEMIAFIAAKDISGLNKVDPGYMRSLLVADIKESDFIANNHPDEIRYNVFQSLQYLTDWLTGSGCVALPAQIDGVAVRVMDDLATAERSRWEVWHEIYHGRFSLDEFLKIVEEEMLFIRKDLSNKDKIVQVKWDERTAKWYPVALKLMVKLMTEARPPEFATELLMTFTVSSVRASEDPWMVARETDPCKYSLDPHTERFMQCFEACGSFRFASKLARGLTVVDSEAREIVLSFSKEEIIEAAKFHGNIGEGKATLDAQAQREQAQVFAEEAKVQDDLRRLGAEYLRKFGIKFLVFAQGRSGRELLAVLVDRLANTDEQELKNAREALWQIALKRLREKSLNGLALEVESLRQKHKIQALGVSLLVKGEIQSLALGEAKTSAYFQIASLSKSVASAFAIEYFAKKEISLSTSVNALLAQTSSSFRLTAVSGVDADAVRVDDLLSHTALNLHYVNGFSLNEPMPPLERLLAGDARLGYEPTRVIHPPSSQFQYSGGGFMVLEHLIEALEKRPVQELISEFLKSIEVSEMTFDPKDSSVSHATGFFDDGEKVPGGRMMFPGFAAGASATSGAVAMFIKRLTQAYQNLEGSLGLSHETAVRMLFGVDKGSRDFMGALMGLGVFVLEGGPNKFMLHQGANEGFRALFLHCFSGPDCGQGMVILCNADNRGVSFIAEVSALILKAMRPEGIDFAKLNSANLELAKVSQEQIINFGYKHLIFSAFRPSRAEEIEVVGPRSELLAISLLSGAHLEFVSNDRFARAENLISLFEPVFDPELFGVQGKIMDSWESVRHNPKPFDSLHLRLQKASSVKFVYLSTKFHDGNHPEHVRILGRDDGGSDWVEVLPLTAMQGHSWRKIKLARESKVFRQIRVEMYPDGGLTRVALFRDFEPDVASEFVEISDSKPQRFTDVIPKTKKPLSIPFHPTTEEVAGNFEKVGAKAKRINLASLAFGAKMLKATNEHYGPAVQLLSPYPPINMFDGIESARSRRPGHFEEAIVELAKPSRLTEIILDYTYFVNNNPLKISIDGLAPHGEWLVLVPETDVKAFAGRKQKIRLQKRSEVVSQIRLRTLPDGGINRLLVFGD
jgi:malate synthase